MLATHRRVQVVCAVNDPDAAEPKVRELDVAVIANEHVVRLHVAVDDALWRSGLVQSGEWGYDDG